MNHVDKRRVRASFSRSADRYDSRATVQRRVRERVLAMLGAAAPREGRILDVGAGTGALLARVAEERPRLAAAAVDLAPGMCGAARTALPRAVVAAADAEALPFRAGTFDAVVSTSTFQWLPRLGPALAEAHRVLVPGGLLCIAFFGERTLAELRDSWRAATSPHGPPARTHRFFGRGEVAGSLDAAGFVDASVLEEDVVEWHEDARAVLRSLKEIGAASAVPGRAGLGGRAAILEALRRYDLHAGPDGVPATYHVLYALAVRRPARSRTSRSTSATAITTTSTTST